MKGFIIAASLLAALAGGGAACWMINGGCHGDSAVQATEAVADDCCPVSEQPTPSVAAEATLPMSSHAPVRFSPCSGGPANHCPSEAAAQAAPKACGGSSAPVAATAAAAKQDDPCPEGEPGCCPEDAAPVQ